MNGTEALMFQPLPGNSTAFRFLFVALTTTLGEKAYKPQNSINVAVKAPADISATRISGAIPMTTLA